MSPWSTSHRRGELPPDWNQIRAIILARDSFRCRWIENNQRCPARATEVDHIKRGDDHSPGNLRALCHAHHGRKSGQEGVEAKRVKRNKLRRPAEQHPGLL